MTCFRYSWTVEPLLLYNNYINGEQTKGNKLLPTMMMAWYHPSDIVFDILTLTVWPQLRAGVDKDSIKSGNMKNLFWIGLSERKYNSYTTLYRENANSWWFDCGGEHWNDTKDDSMAWSYTLDVGGYWFANEITEIVYHCKWMTV